MNMTNAYFGLLKGMLTYAQLGRIDLNYWKSTFPCVILRCTCMHPLLFQHSRLSWNRSVVATAWSSHFQFPSVLRSLTRSCCGFCPHWAAAGWWQPVPAVCLDPPEPGAGHGRATCSALLHLHLHRGAAAAAGRKRPPPSIPEPHSSPPPRSGTSPCPLAWPRRHRWCRFSPLSSGLGLGAPLPGRWWDTTADPPRTCWQQLSVLDCWRFLKRKKINPKPTNKTRWCLPCVHWSEQRREKSFPVSSRLKLRKQLIGRGYTNGEGPGLDKTRPQINRLHRLSAHSHRHTTITLLEQVTPDPCCWHVPTCHNASASSHNSCCNQRTK